MHTHAYTDTQLHIPTLKQRTKEIIRTGGRKNKSEFTKECVVANSALYRDQAHEFFEGIRQRLRLNME